MSSVGSIDSKLNVDGYKLRVSLKTFSYPCFKDLSIVTMRLQEGFTHIGILMSVKERNW